MLAAHSPRSPRSHISAHSSPSKSSRGAAAAVAAEPHVEYTVEDDPVRHVLYSGLSADKAARKLQSDAYMQARHRVSHREEAARAIIISANVLSMSVMSSQLQMYRWKVSEAQTITEATSILQEEIMDVNKKGYQVSREKAPPMGVSKYATGDGLNRLIERNLDRIAERKKARAERAAAGVFSAQAAATDDDDDDYFAASESLSSVCSADDGAALRGDKRRNPPPPDALTRLVLVDCFTHEPFLDIINNLRYMDKEYGLELIIMIMLPRANDSLTTQGAGVVLTPQHDLTLEAAYQCGYDLVLTHVFDHTVVDFLTNLFVTSSGRWRNDVRSKAAVGNFISLKNILMGRIDMDALKQLVFSEGVDDAEILEMIGTQSLALQGETKQFATAAGKMASDIAAEDAARQREAAARGRARADILVVGSDDDDDGNDNNNFNMSAAAASNPDFRATLSSKLPRLRSAVSLAFGVRSKNDKRVVPLENMSAAKDMLGSHMNPSESVKFLVQQPRPEDGARGSYVEDYALEEEEGGTTADKAMLRALQQEIQRLLAEAKARDEELEAAAGEVERLEKTLAIVKKRYSGGAGRTKGSGSGDLMLNLTKEQQIAILKERLDDANAQIGDLIQVGGGNAYRNRRNNTGSRGGGRRASSGDDTARSNLVSAGGRTNRAQERRRQRFTQMYIEGREGDLMQAHDNDAGVRWMSVGDIDGGDADLEGLSERQQVLAEDIIKSKGDAEQVDATIASLRSALHSLQQRLESGDGSGDAGIDAVRMMKQLQAAVERLEAQKQRVRQLEDMRRMEEVIHRKQLESALAGRDGGRGGSVASTAATAKRKGKGTEKPTGGGRGNAGPLGGSHTSTIASDAGGAVPEKPDKAATALRKQAAKREEEVEAMRAQHAEDLRSLRESMEAEAASARRHDALQREREVSRLLRRLYDKIRQPRTAEYRAILQEELAGAESAERAAQQRLQFALKNIPRQQMWDADEEGIPVSGVIGRIRDRGLRERITGIAAELVSSGLQASQTRQRLQELDAALAQRESTVAALRAQLEEATRVVRAAERDASNADDYLSALRHQRDISEELSRWCDVEILPTLRVAAAASSPSTRVQTLVVPAASATTSTNSNNNDNNDSHTSGGGGAQHVDDDAMLRQLADLLRAAGADGTAGKDTSARRKGTTGSLSVSGRPRRGDDDGDSDSGGRSIFDQPEDLRIEVSLADPRGLRGYEGVSEDVARSDKISLTQRQLYRAAVGSYRSGCLNPDVMADVDAQALESCPPMEDWARLYARLREELTRLLRLTCQRFPALLTVVEAYRQPALEASVQAELAAFAGAGGRDPVSVPFLLALDRALVGWAVDYLSGVSLAAADLRRRQQEAVLSSTALRAANEDAVRHAMRKQLLRNRPLHNIAPESQALLDYAAACVELAEAAQPLLGSSGGGGGGGGVQEVEGPYGMNTAEALEIAEALKKEGHSAEELAALFSRPQEYHALDLKQLYADLAADDELSDENVGIMREIQVELEYLAAVQKQRMEELALRYRLRQRQKQNRERNQYAGLGGSGVGGSGASEAGDGAPGFEVTSGRPGWYGMEAAKRVKSILRRKARPDQLILDGGDVGDELSMRVAFPKPPPRDGTSGDAAGLSALPPLSRRGLSRRQQQQSGEALPTVYTHPRDVTSATAYHRVASQYEFDSADVYLYQPARLTQRLVEYREQINRAVSRLGAGNPAIAQQLGAPYYIAVPAASGAGPPASATGRLAGVPPATSWVYGLAQEDMGALLDREVRRPEDADTMLFLPSRDSAPGVGSSGGGRAGLAGGGALPLNQSRSRRQLYRDGVHGGAEANSFLRSASMAFTTPASVAAQRLGLMLRASMEDASVVTGGGAGAGEGDAGDGGPIGRMGRRQQQQPQEQDREREQHEDSRGGRDSEGDSLHWSNETSKPKKN